MVARAYCCKRTLWYLWYFLNIAFFRKVFYRSDRPLRADGLVPPEGGTGTGTSSILRVCSTVGEGRGELSAVRERGGNECRPGRGGQVFRQRERTSASSASRWTLSRNRCSQITQHTHARSRARSQSSTALSHAAKHLHSTIVHIAGCASGTQARDGDGHACRVQHKARARLDGRAPPRHMHAIHIL
jgi:hypothetical protein